MFDFSIVTNWIHQMLTSVMSEGWAVFIECVAIGVNDVCELCSEPSAPFQPHLVHVRGST